MTAKPRARPVSTIGYFAGQEMLQFISQNVTNGLTPMSVLMGLVRVRFDTEIILEKDAIFHRLIVSLFLQVEPHLHWISMIGPNSASMLNFNPQWVFTYPTHLLCPDFMIPPFLLFTSEIGTEVTRHSLTS